MGLTPIYLFDNTTQSLYVEIKETYKKKLNWLLKI
jgi:hypothetical protein